MSADEFTKLFRHMSERFDRIDQALKGKADKADLDRALGLLDAIAKRQEVADTERLVVAHQLNRLDGRANELAEKMNYRFAS